MKTLYFECNMGATGTMLLSALFDACDRKADFIKSLNEALAPFSIIVSANFISKSGICGTKLSVQLPELSAASTLADTSAAQAKNETEEHLNYLLAHAMSQHEHEHSLAKNTNASNPSANADSLDSLILPDSVKEDVIAIYKLLADATKALCQSASEPFPIKAKKDALMLTNIIGCSLLIHLMEPAQILCSPLHIGSGFSKSGDQVVSVPTPITAVLLKNVPCYTSGIIGSLLDDTNAAILKHFVTQFSTMPVMSLQQIGYGIGIDGYPIANYTRVFWGDDFNTAPVASNAGHPEEEGFSNTDTIVSISCNVDDMTGEALSLATEILLAAGAIDVYTTSIQMKKNRPGVLLTCLCEETDIDKFIGLFFLHTSSQDVRYQTFTRAKLESTIESRHSSYGNVRVKKSSGYGIAKEKLDFEDLKSIVLKNGITIADIEFD